MDWRHRKPELPTNAQRGLKGNTLNTLQQLNESIRLLTREHRTLHVDAETSKATYPIELSLFDQLRLEQASGRRGGGGASGSGSRSPVAMAALILWTEIRESLNTTHISITGTDAPAMTPETKLELWVQHAARSTDDAVPARCLQAVNSWANAIQDLLNPVPSIEINGPCPACKQPHVWTLEDGERIRNTALTATTTEAKCRACHAEWSSTEFDELATSISQEQAA